MLALAACASSSTTRSYPSSSPSPQPASASATSPDGSALASVWIIATCTGAFGASDRPRAPMRPTDASGRPSSTSA